MFWIIGALGLVALAGIVFGARFIARKGGPGTMLWIVLLIPGVVVASLLAQVASIYYRMPVGWIVILVLAAVVMIAIFIQLGRTLKWRAGLMFGVVGLLVAALVLSTLVLMFLPLGGLFAPVFETAAQQIAEANGFDVLLASGEPLKTDYNPIGEIPGEGVAIEYEGFSLQERKAEGALGGDALRSLLAAGEDPLGVGGPPVTGDALYETFEIRGNPALGVEYDDSMTAEKQNLGVEMVRVLAFELDGVEVRIYSHGWMQYEGVSGGEEVYTPVDALSFDEMRAIAASLQPVD